MNQHRGGEARLEVALAQAIINEVKYGPETNQLAELSLLAAFQNRAVGDKLAHALLLLMPSLQYFSIGALLKDGVIVRTSNLLIPGAIDVSATSLRGTAARLAARKNSTLHVKRRAQDATAFRYLELQEVWEQVGATSVLSIPIPAVRSYESASIVETPAAAKEPASEPASHMCHVLHNSNGAVGVVTVGLATESIDLNGRQGKALQAMAHSLSPFLAYYAAPALEELHGDICDVASANAASIAKFRARQQQAEQRIQSPQNDACDDSSKQGSANAHGVSQGMTVTSPFSAVSHLEELSHPADQPLRAALPPGAAASKPSGSSSQLAHNPFAQAATISFSESTSEPPPAHRTKPQQHKQPVSPFAAAAEASPHVFDTCLPFGLPEGTPVDQSAVQRRRGSINSGSAHSETGGSVKSIHSAVSNDPSEEMATDAAHQEHQEDQEGSFTLDAPFVFRRKPVSSVQVRRYSTSTFFQGVLHTPQRHLSQLSSLSTMGTVPEEAPQGEQQQQLPQLQEDTSQEGQQLPPPQQQTIFVDDYTYASVAQQMSRRALSTPSEPAGGTLDLTGVQGQMQAHGSCPGPLLVEAPTSGVMTPDATGTLAAARTHLALQGQINKGSEQHDVTVRHTAAASALAHADPTGKSPPLSSRQLDASTSQVDETCMDPGVSHLGHPKLQEISSPVKRACSPPSATRSAVHQHPLWLTFVDPRLEEGFGMWMGQRCSKVDTIFLLAAIVYITQLLFYTWALEDQQAKKWPLLGYAMLPVLLLQHGDTPWYLKNRSVIVTTVRCVLLAFLTCLVPAIVEGSDAPPSRFIDSSGLWPLVVISLALLVRFKLHLAIHAISCASLVLQGLKKCTAEPHSSRLSCQVLSVERLALVTCIPTVFLYILEKNARVLYLQTTKH